MKLAANLHEQVATHLRIRILSGELKPGTPLGEQDLAQEFGISRGPIRDAFLKLAKDGLLHARPNVGVRVAEEPSPFKRKLLVELRQMVEQTALEAWFKSRDPQLLQQLDANLAEYKRACEGTNFGRVVELDMEFHRLLVGFADGGNVVDIWLPIILRMFLRYSRHHALIESYNEHAAIVGAMHAGDQQLALSLLKDHIV